MPTLAPCQVPSRRRNTVTEARRAIDLDVEGFKDQSKRHITLAEARRAIYLDVEGFKDQAPAVVGWQVEGVLRQVVCEKVLAPAADAKSLSVMPFAEVMQMLAHIAEDERRRIVAFSEHELTVSRKFSSADIEPFYGNARAFLKRWWNRCRPFERPGEWTRWPSSSAVAAFDGRGT